MYKSMQKNMLGGGARADDKDLDGQLTGTNSLDQNNGSEIKVYSH